MAQDPFDRSFRRFGLRQCVQRPPRLNLCRHRNVWLQNCQRVTRGWLVQEIRLAWWQEKARSATQEVRKERFDRSWPKSMVVHPIQAILEPVCNPTGGRLPPMLHCIRYWHIQRPIQLVTRYCPWCRCTLNWHFRFLTRIQVKRGHGFLQKLSTSQVHCAT